MVDVLLTKKAESQFARLSLAKQAVVSASLKELQSTETPREVRLKPDVFAYPAGDYQIFFLRERDKFHNPIIAILGITSQKEIISVVKAQQEAGSYLSSSTESRKYQRTAFLLPIFILMIAQPIIYMSLKGSGISPRPNPDIKEIPHLPSPSSLSPYIPSVDVPEELSYVEARVIIAEWLEAQQYIFAPPFDRQLAARLTTGKLLEDITKPGGKIDWLQKNNAYYKYRGIGEIENIFIGHEPDSFSVGRVAFCVRFVRDEQLFVNGKIDRAQSGDKSREPCYVFKFTDGVWKISDVIE